MPKRRALAPGRHIDRDPRRAAHQWRGAAKHRPSNVFAGASERSPTSSRARRSCTAPDTGWRCKRSIPAARWSSRARSHRFDAADVLDVIEAERVNNLLLVGGRLRPSAGGPNWHGAKRDLSSLRYIMTGGRHHDGQAQGGTSRAAYRKSASSIPRARRKPAARDRRSAARRPARPRGRFRLSPHKRRAVRGT